MNRSKPKLFAIIACVLLALLFAYRAGQRARPGELAADPPGILREVRALKELVTVRYSIEKVAGLTEQKVPVGSESILLIVHARVLGGIDLQQLREADIRVAGRGRRVFLNLPESAILHVYVDEKNTKVWDRNKTWWTPWVPYSKDLEHKARLIALDSVKQEALDMGILPEAKANAQGFIRALLKQLGVEEVNFAGAT